MKSLLPTRKWVAAQVVGLCGIGIMWATTGAWDTEETVAICTLVSQAATTWALPNLSTPGGVPLKKAKRVKR